MVLRFKFKPEIPIHALIRFIERNIDDRNKYTLEEAKGHFLKVFYNDLFELKKLKRSKGNVYHNDKIYSLTSVNYVILVRNKKVLTIIRRSKTVKINPNIQFFQKSHGNIYIPKINTIDEAWKYLSNNGRLL